MKPNETFIQDPFAYGGYGNGIGSSLKALSGSALGWLGNKFMRATTTEQKQRESANGTAQPYPIQNIKEAFEQRPNTIQMIPLPKTNTTQASTVIDKPQNIPIAQTISNNMGPSDLSRFSNGKTATPQNALDMYGKVPGSAIIRDAKTGKVLAKGLGEATGGFARNEDLRLKDVAAEEARVNNFWADAAKQRAMETSDRQNSMMAQLDSAIRSGNQEQAVMLTNALKGVGAIQPMNYGANENQLAEARTRQTALPYIGPKAKAETSLQNAQAEYYAGKNATDRGNKMYEGYLKTLLEKMKSSGSKSLSATDWKALSDLQMTNPEMYAKAMADLNRQG